MEDDLKILKVEYLSNSLLDPTHILNLSSEWQTILYKSFIYEFFSPISHTTAYVGSSVCL